MDRRAFIAACRSALLAAPLAAEAQPAAKVVPRSGMLARTSRPRRTLGGASGRRLRELGYVEGQNIVIEYRWAEGRFERLPELAAELVRLKVDVIVTAATPATRRGEDMRPRTIPIVFAAVGDPVGAGFVASLARPGGNVTGVSSIMRPSLARKRLELLKEAVPGVSRVAVLWNPDNHRPRADR